MPEEIDIDYSQRFQDLLRESQKHWAYYEAGSEIMLGELLWAKMEEKGLDLKGLSEKSGISYNLLRDLFGGSKVWNLRLMARVAFAMGYEVTFGLKTIEIS